MMSRVLPSVMDSAHKPAGAEALAKLWMNSILENAEFFRICLPANKDRKPFSAPGTQRGDIVFACEAPTQRTRKAEEIGTMLESQKIKAEFKAEHSG